MYKIFSIFACLLILFMASPAKAQDIDSAEWVVARFMALTNYDALPTDSMLYIESVAVSRSNPSDTTVVRRWFAKPNSCRIEVLENGTLTTGYHNNEHHSYRKFDPSHQQWIEASPLHFFDMTLGYDFRGPLYKRNTNGCALFYKGTGLFKGNKVFRIGVTTPGMYDRDYYFEYESGLLFLYTEQESSFGEEKLNAENHIDWRMYHEYLPVGQMIIASLESYQLQNTIITVTHSPRLMPYDTTVFDKD